MSRPWVLVCLLMLLVLTSNFEWKQQYSNEIEASPITSKRQQYISGREESVKEKEKKIQKLNELIRGLQEQLAHCKGEKEVDNTTATPLAEILTELERQPLLDD